MMIQRQSAVDRAKAQMSEIKKKLPRNWRQIYFQMFPEYDSREGGDLLDNVYFLRTTDMFILDNIKFLIKNLNKKS